MMCGTSVAQYVAQKTTHKRLKIAGVALWHIFRTYILYFYNAILK